MVRAYQTLSLDLGPDQTVCNQQVFTFKAQEGFTYYRWHDGSIEPTYTAWEEGKYWVEATDGCGLVKTDTVQVSYDEATVFDLGPDTLICQGESVRLKGVAGFDKYQWYPEKSISCSDCMESVLTPDTTTTYFLVATNATGCISSDTLRIEVGYPSERSETMSICKGDEVEIFGKVETEAGLYSKTFTSRAGCDSLVQIQLQVVEGKNSQETITICEGESVLIFGESQNEPGPYTQSFNDEAECDSTHTVFLEVLSPINISENIALCNGQSIELFGETINVAGSYQQTFTAINGCDSTHQYIVTVQDTIRIQEEISLCQGSSITVFGQSISTSGSFSQSFVAASGCDSIHQIDVVMLDTVSTLESLQICQGESISIFDIERSTSGLYQARFVGANGCDSIHNIQLEVLNQVTSSEEISICEGATYPIFGELQSEAGLYSKTFTGINGCDSTHHVRLEVHSSLITQETIQVCPGDSVLVFGNYVYESGQIQQSFTSSFGCDSIHIFEVIFSTPIIFDYDISKACTDQQNGAITLIGSQNPSYQYQWSNGQTSNRPAKLISRNLRSYHN